MYLLLPLTKGHLSNVATISWQIGWPYYREKETTVYAGPSITLTTWKRRLTEQIHVYFMYLNGTIMSNAKTCNVECD